MVKKQVSSQWLEHNLDVRFTNFVRIDDSKSRCPKRVRDPEEVARKYLKPEDEYETIDLSPYGVPPFQYNRH